MKLVQQESFSPIAIILETRDEAEMFWKMMREVDVVYDPALSKMVTKLCNLFSNEAHL